MYAKDKNHYQNQDRIATKCETPSVSVEHKVLLTIQEAAAYSNIGQNKISQMLNTPNCPFVLFVGRKRLVKREAFEKFISTALQIAL